MQGGTRSGFAECRQLPRRLSCDDYVGLHQRYARLLNDVPQVFIAGRKEREEDIRRQLSVLFDGMMKAVYKTPGAELSIDILSTPQVREFIDAHAGVLDSSFERTSMSEAMRRRLQRSDFIFSGMKAFHELNEAFPSMLDENGERKPFERFLNDVRSIDETYNANYLRAEYNFVSASAEMAAKWEEFSQDGDRYNLQYRTQKDDKVRPEHAALDGVTLPPSDSFWEEFYPPNGWNCRCTVVQVRKSKYPATDHDEAMTLGDVALQRDTKGMFRFNAGAEESTVPDYNPYTISKCKNCDIAKGKGLLMQTSADENQVCEACRWVRDCWRKNEIKKGVGISNEEKDSILSLPREQQLTMEFDGVKGKVYQHLLVCEASVDHEFVLDVAKAFANADGDCIINPELRTQLTGRSNYYNRLPVDSKCNPDLDCISYGYVDVKSPDKPGNWCRNAIHASDKQHSCVCLTNHRTPIDLKEIPRWNNLIWRDPNYHHDYIFWFVDGTLLKYKRP